MRKTKGTHEHTLHHHDSETCWKFLVIQNFIFLLSLCQCVMSMSNVNVNVNAMSIVLVFVRSSHVTVSQ